jgi:hypothetical protein
VCTGGASSSSREGSSLSGQQRALNTTVRPLPFVVALVGAALLTGCKNTVTGGGESGEGGAGGSGTVTSGATTVGHGPTTSAATTSGPVTNAAVTVGVSTGGGVFSPAATLRRNTPEVEEAICFYSEPCDIPADALVLVLDSAAPACGLPLERSFPTGEGWRAVVVIPADKLTVGTYVLEEHPEIFVASVGYEQSAANGTSGATVGGGSTADGEIEIFSVNGLEVSLRTTGLTLPYVDSDGDYTTTSCE